VGTLSLPKTGRVYVDAAPVIYTVERKKPGSFLHWFDKRLLT